MKHVFVTDEYGNVDHWQLDEDYHNGPRCMRCGRAICEHCESDVFDEECRSQQVSIFESENV